MVKLKGIFYALYTMMIIIIGAFYMSSNPVSFEVEILHPGISRSEKTKKILYRVDYPNEEYFMKVATVVCGDDQCRIDTIAVYWDTLGFYDRIELPDSVSLEKSEGAHFTNEDYQKLDKILSNRNSSLIDVYKEEVVGSESSDAVDGVSGATIILNTNDYVAGAVWTCYTLWHWVNGDVHQVIRDIHGAETELTVLIKGLQGTSDRTRNFSLEQLQKRGVYTDQVMKSLDLSSQSVDNQYAKMIIDYLESTDNIAFYYQAITQLLERFPLEHRSRLLTSLLAHAQNPGPAYMQKVVQIIGIEGSFQEVDLLLRTFNKHRDSNNLAVDYALKLLQSESFLVARRAYWFLDSQALNSSQREVLKFFYSKNRARL